MVIRSSSTVYIIRYGPTRSHIDGGVQVAVADGGAAVPVAGGGGGGGGLFVLVAAGLAYYAPPAAVGDVAELFDVHVHQLARRRPLVAAHRPAADPVQV